jgi:hypothetical protein
MFQNTANDLRQCLEAMDAAETMEELELSRDEKRSYDLMREYCENFLNIAERLDDADADAFGVAESSAQAEQEAAAFIAAEDKKVASRYGYVPKLHPSEWKD